MQLGQGQTVQIPLECSLDYCWSEELYGSDSDQTDKKHLSIKDQTGSRIIQLLTSFPELLFITQGVWLWDASVQKSTVWSQKGLNQANFEPRPYFLAFWTGVNFASIPLLKPLSWRRRSCKEVRYSKCNRTADSHYPQTRYLLSRIVQLTIR